MKRLLYGNISQKISSGVSILRNSVQYNRIIGNGVVKTFLPIYSTAVVKQMSDSSPFTADDPQAIVCSRFNNFEIGQIIDFWNQCKYPKHRRQPVYIDNFEKLVFAKPFFDPQGFIIAKRGTEIVGFAHAGFAPTADGSDLDYSFGAIPMVCYNDDNYNDIILNALLEECEKYLVGKGATHIQLGAYYPQAPFYLGMLRGCDLPGVFLDELPLIQVAQQRGYALQSPCTHYRRGLEEIDWTFQHDIRQLRRKYNLQMEYCPTPAEWEKAIAMSGIIWSHFSLIEAGRGIINPRSCIAQCALWVIDDLPMGDLTIVGISQFYVAPEFRGQQLGFFLLTEVLRRLVDQRVAGVQFQVLDEHIHLKALLEEKKFEPFRHSALFAKSAITSSQK